MDKTLNINLGGNLFQIDEDAFKILRDYLQAINNRFRNVQGGLETIEDIEIRIAEIFQSQKGLAGVITKDNVEAMISIIGKPEDFDQDDNVVEQQIYTGQKRRMYRNPDDTIISGVCGGIGAYLNVDPGDLQDTVCCCSISFWFWFFHLPCIMDSTSGSSYRCSKKRIIRELIPFIRNTKQASWHNVFRNILSEHYL